ncbi:MAG: hypothetical protein J6C46_00825 [Clostridia bacterium]|nr:hypothetical protein [Clostridia bacterium]
MRFQPSFSNKSSVKIEINHLNIPNSVIEVPVEEIIELLHDIADDFDMLKPQDKKDLQFAIGRIQGEYDA